MPPLLIGQSGGATPVINASLAGAITAAQQAGFYPILGLAFGVRGLIEQRFIPLHHLSADQLSVLAQTPSAALGLCRYKLTPADLQLAMATLTSLRPAAFLYIGGNDSAETTLAITREVRSRSLNISIIAIPKTIDNDLPHMDHTPGYGSAARFIAIITRHLTLDAWAMQREEKVRILEVYGRDTGWLAAAAFLSEQSTRATPLLALIPERPFREDWFLDRVSQLVRNYGYCQIIVGEMLRNATGALIGQTHTTFHDAFGHPETRRPGEYLRSLIQEKLALRSKDDRPGSIQKVGAESISDTDRQEAFQLGSHAVSAAVTGYSGVMVALQRLSHTPYRVSPSLLPLEDIAGHVRPIPLDLLDDEGQPNERFCRYATPLIGQPLPVIASPFKITSSASVSTP